MSMLCQVEVFVERERASERLQCKETRRNGWWFQCLFDFIPHGVWVCMFTIQITFSLMLIAHTHQLTIIGASKQNENRKAGEETINIHTHSMQMDIRKLQKRGRTWFLLTFVLCWNNTIWRCTQNEIKSKRCVYRNVHQSSSSLTHLQINTQEVNDGAFLFYFWAPTILLAHKIRNWKEITSIFGACMQCQHYGRGPRICTRGCEPERQRTNQTCEWGNAKDESEIYMCHIISKCELCSHALGAHTLIAI